MKQVIRNFVQNFMVFFTSIIIASDVVNRLYHDYDKAIPKSYIYYSVALGCALLATVYMRYFSGKKIPVARQNS